MESRIEEVLESAIEGKKYDKKPLSRIEELLIEWSESGGGVSPEEVAKQIEDALLDYYDKTETYSKEEVKEIVSTIPKFSIEVVDELPTIDISSTTVYLLKSGEETSNLYDEYIYVKGSWEKLGTQSVDLSGYMTNTMAYRIYDSLSSRITDNTNLMYSNFVQNSTLSKTLSSYITMGTYYSGMNNVYSTISRVVSSYNNDINRNIANVIGRISQTESNIYSSISTIYSTLSSSYLTISSAEEMYTSLTSFNNRVTEIYSVISMAFSNIESISNTLIKNYYTSTLTDAKFVSKSALSSTLSDYVTTTTFSSTISSYATQQWVRDYTTMEKGYVTYTVLNDSMNYVYNSINTLSSNLIKNYVTNTQLYSYQSSVAESFTYYHSLYTSWYSTLSNHIDNSLSLYTPVSSFNESIYAVYQNLNYQTNGIRESISAINTAISSIETSMSGYLYLSSSSYGNAHAPIFISNNSIYSTSYISFDAIDYAYNTHIIVERYGTDVNHCNLALIGNKPVTSNGITYYVRPDGKLYVMGTTIDTSVDVNIPIFMNYLCTGGYSLSQFYDTANIAYTKATKGVQLSYVQVVDNKSYKGLMSGTYSKLSIVDGTEEHAIYVNINKSTSTIWSFNPVIATSEFNCSYPTDAIIKAPGQYIISYCEDLFPLGESEDISIQITPRHNAITITIDATFSNELVSGWTTTEGATDLEIYNDEIYGLPFKMYGFDPVFTAFDMEKGMRHNGAFKIELNDMGGFRLLFSTNPYVYVHKYRGSITVPCSLLL